MSEIKVVLREERVEFHPGEELVGAGYWKLERAPETAEARLIWFTRGKGTEDVEVVEKFSFPNPQREEAQPFRFRLPVAPYSFSGKLISLIWAVEVVFKSPREARRSEFILSPSGKEIVLGQVGK